MGFIKLLTHKIKLTSLLSLMIGLLFASSIIVISSYLMAGWLMRPTGDDYGSLIAYHQGSTWLTSLPHTVITGGGRYAQTFIAVLSYGAFGSLILKLTSFLAVSLLLTAVYLALRSMNEIYDLGIRRPYIWFASSVGFMLYTLISVTFPWSRGSIDNSFQNILWFPGFITYTLPFSLLVIFVSTLYLKRKYIIRHQATLLAILPLAIILGTFNEIVTMLYLLFLGACAFLNLNKLKRRIKWRHLYQVLRPFAILGLGLIIGLFLNYISPATAQRRAVINSQPTPTTQLLAHTANETIEYVHTYIIYGQERTQLAMLFAIIVGMVLGFTLTLKFQSDQLRRLVSSLLPLGIFIAYMTIGSLVVSFFAVFKGYGIGSYLTPRFEIFYNSWLCLFLVWVGLLIYLSLVIKNSGLVVRRLTPAITLLLFLAVLANTPNILTLTTRRLQTVAVFSAAWEKQDKQLRDAARNHASSITITVIDIGDGYNFHCGDTSPDNWLGAVKQQYYHIPKICSKPD